MKIYSNRNVLEAAKARIKWIFDEFENVVVSSSGGKDSTIVFELALAEAQSRGEKLKVLFLDQEAEWQATIDAVREQMEHPDVEPYWLQVPFRLFNATSTEEHWLQCWSPEEEDRWIRPKEDYAITENNLGTDRFSKMFTHIPKAIWPDKRTAFLAGVRAEESPSRAAGLTGTPGHKWVTWVKKLKITQKEENPNLTFYPIYDWSYTDVWKAIHEHGWSYCKLYDHFYRYGVETGKMRVSNVHHETAVWSLFIIQEVEPETYEKLVQRISGIDMAGKMGFADYFPKEVPPMFSGWREYRDHLLDKLIEDEDWKERFKKNFARMELDLAGHNEKGMYKCQARAVLCNDWEGVKMDNFMAAPQNYGIAKANRKARKEATEASDPKDGDLPIVQTHDEHEDSVV